MLLIFWLLLIAVRAFVGDGVTAVVSDCEDEVVDTDEDVEDEEGFAKRTPSYEMPFTSMVTDNCCSPVDALPVGMREREWI